MAYVHLPDPDNPHTLDAVSLAAALDRLRDQTPAAYAYLRALPPGTFALVHFYDYREALAYAEEEDDASTADEDLFAGDDIYRDRPYTLAEFREASPCLHPHDEFYVRLAGFRLTAPEDLAPERIAPVFRQLVFDACERALRRDTPIGAPDGLIPGYILAETGSGTLQELIDEANAAARWKIQREYDRLKQLRWIQK